MQWWHEMSKSKSFLRNLMRPFTSRSNREDRDEVDIERIAEQERKQFSFQVLFAATQKFHQSRKLGEGGFGAVYKGTLGDGREIAVKRLSERSSQGKKEFQTEAKLLAGVQHRNVVHLLGYCAHEDEKLLVYEFVANDSLDKLLFKSDKREDLNWKRRHDVITGVAKGLHYLHEEAHTPIIHRDIKASNILLDDKWVPKIADFGMARLYPEDKTVNTRAAGTNGYMAPEYLMYGKLSKKADVFSYGVVVLELISGQKNSTFNRDPDSKNLLDWAYKLYKKNRSWEIMDPALASSIDYEQVQFCIWLGLMCVQSDPALRPEMERVVVMLSRKPSNLVEPTRPGYPGSRFRGYHRTATSSLAGTSGETSSSKSYESTSTPSATMSATTSGITNTSPRRKRHGKQRMKE